MPRRFTVTAGLPYSNGPLHVGHIAGCYLPADTYARYLRARGDEVRYVCGSDDNGVASLRSAEKEGRSVEALTADYNARQQAAFAGLGIRFDVYGGTHQPGFVERHEQFSQAFFRTIHDKGYLVKRVTDQLYDPVAGRFLPDRYVRGTCYHTLDDGSPCGYTEADGSECEQCGNAIDALCLVEPRSEFSDATPEARPTTHWFLRLAEFEEPLSRWLEAGREPRGDRPAWRETVLNFALGQIREGLPERAMTRDLDWGVPVPLDDPEAAGKVLYVWFDAPIGYVSFTAEMCRRDEADWRGYERWWKDPDTRIVHFIGEDNTIFHALIWPAMLMAEGSYQLPANVVANKFLNIRFPGRDEEKISKSRGTAIWIHSYLERFDPDPLRYYLTAIAPESRRTTFDVDDFVARNNGELVNALGNFVNRTMTFAGRYHEGRVPAAGALGEPERAQLGEIDSCARRVTSHLEAYRFRAALGEVMALARAGNGYLDVRQPWSQRKTDPVACGTTIHVCLRTVRALATLMAPFLPHAASACAGMLGLDGGADGLRWDDVATPLPDGQPLGEPTILFEKLDPEALFVDGAAAGD